MPATATVNSILKHSFVDGPGNRAVIFLQGCMFNCLYCHNPYTINLCNHCGECVPVCPTGALSMVEGRVLWDASLCESCDTCIRACPHSSSPRTRRMTAADVWAEIAPLAPFLSGVTVSGGEPTLQLNFLVEFFTLVKEQSNLTTLIESNGCLTPNRLERLLPVLDYAMVDLKAWEPEVYRELTGQDGAFTRETIRLLAGHGKLHAVRQVVAPGYTDTDENAAATARFVAEIDPAIPLRFLRFRAHGTRGIAQSWPSPDDDLMDHLVAVAQQQGLADVSRSL